jgi:membrane peptidoglycan carboxypeptidase
MTTKSKLYIMLQLDHKNIDKKLEKPKTSINMSSVLGFLHSLIKPLTKIIGSLIALGMGLVIIGLIVAGFWLSGRYNALGSIKERITRPSEGSVVMDRNGVEMFKYFNTGEQREIVDINEIPETIQSAVVVMEDENFYYNADGIPWTNLAGSVYKCFVTREGCRGGSGLSQQLIKKTITNRVNATLGNKIDELLGAYKFNQEVDKKEVLNLYLNIVPFGRNSYGVQEAARTYLGRDINAKTGPENNRKPELTIPEACFIGSMLPKPEDFAKAIQANIDGKFKDEIKEDNIELVKLNNNWQELVGRKNSCIDKLATKQIKGEGTGTLITPAEAIDLKKVEVSFKSYKSLDASYGHIKNFLTEEFKSKLDLDEKDLTSRGMQIKTTFDLGIQKKIEEIVQKGVRNNLAPNGGNNAAAIVLEGDTGKIVAMVGSADFTNKEIDGEVNIVTAPRQPGSSIKPYVYASMMEKNGFNPSTMLVDNSIDFGNYKPLNYDKKFYGPVSIRWALQNSLNIPAVKALYLSAEPSDEPNGQNGLDNFFKFTNKLGLDFPLKVEGQCGVGTALGGCEITMLSHAQGINTLLHDGQLIPVTPFSEIIDTDTNYIDNKNGKRDLFKELNQIEKNPYAKKDAVEPTVAREIANIMSDDSNRDNGIWGNTKQYFNIPGFKVAAKSGTTNDVKDMWMVGGSPYYTVLVWGGNTDGTPMYIEASSSGVMGPIWKEIMTYLHVGKEKKEFSKVGLGEVKIDSRTGLLDPNGKIELMSNKQLDILKKTEEKSKKGEFKGKESVFATRSFVTNNKLKVTKADNLLVPEGSDIPEQYTQIITCSIGVGEFPGFSGWNYGYGGGCPSGFTKFTKETIEKGSETTMTANVSAGAKAPERLTVTIKPSLAFVKITNIEVSAGGEIIGQGEGDLESLTIETKDIPSGQKDVTVKTKDSLGKIQDFVIPKIIFGEEKAVVEISGNSSSQSSLVNSQSNITSLNNVIIAR